MALAKVIYVKWVHEGKVYTGDFCTAQGKSARSFVSLEELTNIFVAGILQQLGDTGSALATLVDITIFSETAPS
jgi:hypothetical protein